MTKAVDTPKARKRRRRSERNAAMYDDETVEFIQAIDAYRRRFDRSFPAWSEVLQILYALGYRKVAEPVPIQMAQKLRNEQGELVEPVEPADDDE